VSLARLILDLVFPPLCVGCRRRGDWLCANCRAGLTELGADGVLGRTGALDGAYAAHAFDGALREAIHHLKYRGARHLAEPLGELLVESYWLGPLTADLIVPVPLHPSRQSERGYNQSELLARQLSAAISLPYDAGVLRRSRPTAAQTHLSAEERRRNVAGAFVAGATLPKGTRVLLVDDVLTTGSTASACATALRSAGAAGVAAVTVARALGPDRSRRPA
jgi:ComF family protein